MEGHYTSEKTIQILIALLKAHNIKQVVISPGTTNVTLVGSIQSDPFFKCYSSVDERSAAYIATGLAAETGEPVALSCTGATASRNYYPGLTEAYYRNLPVLALTSSQVFSHTGNYFPQMLDRTVTANDIVKHSVSISTIKDADDEWDVTNKINVALLELRRNGGGPVLINYAQSYSADFSVKELPSVKTIRRVTYNEEFPELPKGRIAIYAGSHEKWSLKLTEYVNEFCKNHNAVVFGDHTGNYKGEYKVLSSLFGSQDNARPSCLTADLIIYIGYVSGEYTALNSKKVWRVNPDGELRNVFKNTEYIFQMKEEDFFEKYKNGSVKENEYIKECKAEYKKVFDKIPELPFGNIWCAKQMSSKLPENSVLHLGILNTLRSWNFFDIPDSVNAYSNVGGFGIDGDISSLIGASLAHPEKLYIGILGDLAFFYDMNVVGNHIVQNNVRIMLVNNGRGTEFRNYNHPAEKFGEVADRFMAAAGHFGKKSHELIKHYAQDLGYEYLTASTKEEFLANYEKFLSPEITEKPILFEVFTNSEEESEALRLIRNIESDASTTAKHLIKNVIGQEGVSKIKKLLGK